MCVSVAATMGVSSSKPKMKRTHTHTHLSLLFPLHTHSYAPHTSLDNQPPHPPSCLSPSLSASPHSSGGNPKGRTHFAPHGNSSNDEDAGKDDADEGEGSVKWPTGCAGGYGGTGEKQPSWAPALPPQKK